MSIQNPGKTDDHVDLIRSLDQELRDTLDMVALGYDDSLEVSNKADWGLGKARRKLRELRNENLLDSEFSEEASRRKYMPSSEGQAIYELVDVDVRYVPDLDASGPEILTYLKNEGEVSENELNYFVREMLEERKGTPRQLSSRVTKAAQILDELEELDEVEYIVENASYVYNE